MGTKVLWLVAMADHEDATAALLMLKGCLPGGHCAADIDRKHTIDLFESGS
jgi:hypothetical protein